MRSAVTLPEGTIAYGEFATDPCRSLFKRVMSMNDVFKFDNAAMLAHRYAYTLRAGPIPPGMWILHAAEGSLSEFAPFQLLHEMDLQPSLNLNLLQNRGEGAQ